uniref:Uncharacterized protein n=1 Tax=Arion vulgaris TaxID=1028688 RepID=A0A0B7AVY3_9EUPU
MAKIEGNNVLAQAEVQTLTSEKSSEYDVIIYTYGSVTQHVQSSWAFTAQVREDVVKKDSDGFAVTASSFTMEIMAVTKTIVWLESHTFYPYMFSQGLNECAQED